MTPSKVGIKERSKFDIAFWLYRFMYQAVLSDVNPSKAFMVAEETCALETEWGDYKNEYE